MAKQTSIINRINTDNYGDRLIGFCMSNLFGAKTECITTLDYAFRTKRNTCKEVNGFAGLSYQVEAYGIEYFEVDEDGEFVEGSDFDGAEDEKEVLQ